MVRLFLDTANLDQLREGVSIGCFSGATINPALLFKESSDYIGHVKRVLSIVPKDWDLSFQVRCIDVDETVKQARYLASIDERIRIKIPATTIGLKAAKILAKEVKLNLTVIKSPAQAILCQALAINLKAKDIYISIFCDRIRQAGYDWHQIIRVLSSVEWPGKIIAASIKSPKDIFDAIACGADIVTAPLEVYKRALESPLIKEDVELFNSCFEKGLSLPLP